MKIGVLAFQGGVCEHINCIEKLGHCGVLVKTEKDLENIDGIILPGGESTTIGKLLNITGLMNPLRERIKNGLPVWGTCAGMIILAKNIEDNEKNYLNLMDITVKRNAFGTQIDSFKTLEKIECIGNTKMELVFIRAPYITHIGKDVEVICKVNDKIVAAKERNMLVTSFHPELTPDLRFLEYFISLIKENKNCN